MNVGEEEGKGHDLANETHALFNAGPEGPVRRQHRRPRHPPRRCDVVVTDGFVGNVVLKLSEGVFEFIMKMVAKEMIGPLPNDQAVAMKALQALIARYDYSTFGGAPLLGIDGICIICHGSSSGTGDQERARRRRQVRPSRSSTRRSSQELAATAAGRVGATSRSVKSESARRFALALLDRMA